MIQNSLDRILDGMVAQLRDVIAQELPEGYARAQALAMAEMLGNLGTRIEWRCDQLAEVVELAGMTAPAGNAELLEARSRALVEIGRRAAAGDPAARAAARRLVEIEASRLRTGMYRKPQR